MSYGPGLVLLLLLLLLLQEARGGTALADTPLDSRLEIKGLDEEAAGEQGLLGMYVCTQRVV